MSGQIVPQVDPISHLATNDELGKFQGCIKAQRKLDKCDLSVSDRDTFFTRADYGHGLTWRPHGSMAQS